MVKDSPQGPTGLPISLRACSSIPLPEAESNPDSHIVVRNRRRCFVPVIGGHVHIFAIDGESVEPTDISRRPLQRGCKTKPASCH